MWKQQFVIFLKTAGYDKKPSDDKACLLLNCIGSLGLEVMQDMEFDNEEDKLDYDIVLQKFDEHFDPPKREVEERFKFYTRSKKNNEPIEDYIADLKEKAKTCNFGELTESLVRDMVILDIKDKTLRKIIFQEKQMDIDKLIMLYKQYELSTEKMKEVTKKVASEKEEQSKGDQTKGTATAENKTSAVCWKCGISHPPRNCPAFKAECQKCKEKGHFTQRCRNKNTNTNINQNTPNKNYSKNPFNQTKKQNEAKN
jgi:hypothetical protein